MKVCVVSGSARKDNNTLKLAKAISLYYGAANTSIIDFKQYDLPYFNGDALDRNNPTAFQKSIYTSMTAADLIIVLSPEYNWFPTGEVVNFIHQIATNGNKDLFENKVFAFAGVSTGQGGKLPAMQLSQVIGKLIHHFNLETVVSSKIFEAWYIQNELTEDGVFVRDEYFKKFLVDFLEYNKKLTIKWVVNDKKK